MDEIPELPAEELDIEAESQPAATAQTVKSGDLRAPLSAPRPTLLHSGMSVDRFYKAQLMGVAFALAAALLLYGWRAALLFSGVVTCAGMAWQWWRRIGCRGPTLHLSHVLWSASLLALMLPVSLAGTSIGSVALWPVLPAAAIALVVLMWTLGGLGAGRIHPLLVCYLLLVVFLRPPFFASNALSPHWALQRSHILLGDALDAAALAPLEAEGASINPWTSEKSVIGGQDALWTLSASQRLIAYTTGREKPTRSWLTLEALVRDQLPPLEDLIIGGQPGPIGLSSAVAIIMGGLFLLYRGLIDFRIPLLIFLGAYLAWMVLPAPVVLTETGAQWRWFLAHQPSVSWALAITFANYELLAGPLLFTGFFLATTPAVRPMARRARALFALATGMLAAILQLYVSVAFGAYLALLLVSLTTPWMDRWFRPKLLL